MSNYELNVIAISLGLLSLGFSIFLFFCLIPYMANKRMYRQQKKVCKELMEKYKHCEFSVTYLQRVYDNVCELDKQEKLWKI